jgi:hypothetical protein
VTPLTRRVVFHHSNDIPFCEFKMPPASAAQSHDQSLEYSWRSGKPEQPGRADLLHDSANGRFTLPIRHIAPRINERVRRNSD